MQLEVWEIKNLQYFLDGQWTKGQFFLFEAKSLGLFKCISLLIKYYMFNEKWKELDCLTQRHTCSLDDWNCVRLWGGKALHCSKSSPHFTCSFFFLKILQSHSLLSFPHKDSIELCIGGSLIYCKLFNIMWRVGYQFAVNCIGLKQRTMCNVRPQCVHFHTF